MVTVGVIIFSAVMLLIIVVILLHFSKDDVEYIKNNYPRAFEKYISSNHLKKDDKLSNWALLKIEIRREKKWEKEEDTIKRQTQQSKQRLQDEKDKIKSCYPLAYKAFIKTNHFPENPSDDYYLKKIIQKPSEEWRKEEEKLRNEIIQQQNEKIRGEIAETERKQKEREEQERQKAEEEKRKAEKERKKAEEEKRRTLLDEIFAIPPDILFGAFSNIKPQVKPSSRLYKPDKEKILNLLRWNDIKCFYHFTAASNLEFIKQNDGLYSWWSLDQKGLKVPFRGGEGIGYSLDKRYGLQDYVRLSFCDDHPMAYRHKMNGVSLILLKIDIEVATWKDTLFSDRNAADSGHHHGGSYDDLNKVDFEAVKMHYVRRDDPEFKPHQAEVMVKSFISIKYIININSPLYL